MSFASENVFNAVSEDVEAMLGRRTRYGCLWCSSSAIYRHVDSFEDFSSALIRLLVAYLTLIQLIQLSFILCAENKASLEGVSGRQTFFL